MVPTADRITELQKRRFHDDGFFIVENVIPQHQLRVLRDEGQRFMDEMDAEMDRQGVDVLDLNHRGRRYFLSMKCKESQAVRELAFGDAMADICRATIGGEAYFFLDQFVMKLAEQGMKFSWHQDSGYIPYGHRTYVTCWCPLDDVTEENGTVYLLPYSRAGTRARLEHVTEEGSNDKVGYHGDDAGIPAIMKAGDVAVFSSTTFHRSGPNKTNLPRRVLLLQYSPEPVFDPDGKPRHWVDPFLQGGSKLHYNLAASPTAYLPRCSSP
jgi:ectoine hydroxylase-related dioxygenase (phytanoyl-CoA dioxygenase family)